jgi:hypothetical protein
MSRFSIIHPIRHIRTGSNNTCWAGATAMARGTRQGRHLMVWDVQQLARAGGVRVNTDGSMPVNDLANTRALATALGMSLKDTRTGALTIRFLKTILQTGPFALFGRFNYPSRMTAIDHVIAVYRIFGDDTDEPNNTISFIDPFDGRAYNYSWDVFDNEISADPHFIIHN